MKRILLASLPFYRLMGSHFNGMSLGISYIASVLKSRNFNVGVYNADYFDSGKYLTQEEIFSGHHNYEAVMKDENHPLWNEVVQNILNWSPDYLGISMYTANYPSAKMVSRKIRKLRPDIKIVVGGVHATLAYRDLMAEDWMDYLIRGEGEFAFLELANNVPLHMINGLSWRDANGAVIHNAARAPIDPLDIIPFPERDLFITPSHNMDLGQIITGRGCPFACTYCASPAMWGRKNVRFRSVYDVVTELELISKKYQSSMIYFSDDTFSLKKDRTIELCNEIIRRGLNISWKCDTRADCLDDELVGAMKDAGCQLVKIGVESGSDRILKLIKKGMTKEKVMAAAKVAKSHGIKLTAYLMIGFPGETNEDVQETIDFAREMNADYYSLSILAPYYGTEIFNTMGEYGIKLEKDHWEYFYHQSMKMLEKSSITPDMIEKFLQINVGRQRI